MEISINWLEKRRANKSLIDWFGDQPERDPVKVVNSIMKKNHNWANWLMIKILDEKQQIKYVLYAAEKVLPILKEKNPDDYKACEYIESAKRRLKDAEFIVGENEKSSEIIYDNFLEYMKLICKYQGYMTLYAEGAARAAFTAAAMYIGFAEYIENVALEGVRLAGVYCDSIGNDKNAMLDILNYGLQLYTDNCK